MRRSRIDTVEAYVTKDGSTIRELMHPAVHGNRNQSLAEATVPAGGATQPHRHHRSEEIYCVTDGHGRMHLGTASFAISAGEVVCIDPGTVHWVENTGDGPLRILCCCAPAYAHDDTELVSVDGPGAG